MSHYNANLRDIEFCLFDLFQTEKVLGTSIFSELDRATAMGMLEEMKRLTENDLAASFVEGDRIGTDFNKATGDVKLPASFIKSYKAYVDGEWWRLDAPVALGGMKVPASIRWAIARTVLVFGIVPDMSRTNIILWVKKSLEEGKQINVVTDQFRTPTLAEDLAMGCWLIAQKEAEGIFNISGEELLTPYEMAIQTAEYFHLPKELIKPADSSTFTQPAKRPPRTGFILDKAKRVLGYQPRSFNEGIALLAKQIQ